MTPPIALEEAWTRLLDLVQPLPVERIAPEAAHGRYLTEPLLAARTQPAADVSSMDGYALVGPGPWAVVGESRCGAPLAAALAAGEAARISTGAVVPDGADRVLIQECARRDGGHLALDGRLPDPGANIRPLGMDFRHGDTLLPAGTRLGPPQVALALAAGVRSLAVHRKPRVAVLDCGNEFLDGSTPATNGAMLEAMIAGLPCEVRRIGPVPDDLGALGEALAQCEHCDLVVTSGAASVGDHDLVRPALEAWGAEIAFWRVAIRPGKPLLVARRGAALVLGLPGNPVSAYVTGFLFALPAIRRMLGAAHPVPRSEPIRCTSDLPPGGERGEFLRAIRGARGLAPILARDSSLLAQLARADTLIWRPPHCLEAKAGTDVPAYRLENGGNA